MGFEYHANSPPARFFSSYICDGGLLILSKFPIVHNYFHLFETPAASDDAMSMKGCLYAKISLEKLGGGHLHIFTTHLQASYLEEELPIYVDTYVARYEQLKEVKQ